LLDDQGYKCKITKITYKYPDINLDILYGVKNGDTKQIPVLYSYEDIFGTDGNYAFISTDFIQYVDSTNSIENNSIYIHIEKDTKPEGESL
jgi:hypothetical protein